MALNRIHLFGASGSGTSSIGKLVAEQLNYEFIDTDDYYWDDAFADYEVKRPIPKRQALLLDKLVSCDKWVLSGSLCGWGDMYIPLFDLAVFVHVPTELRMDRLKERECKRYGSEVLQGGGRYDSSREFLDWASDYEKSTNTGRHRKKHEEWILTLPCPVLRVENNILEDSVRAVIDQITS